MRPRVAGGANCEHRVARRAADALAGAVHGADQEHLRRLP